jgi:hypothetical protein
MTNIELDNVKDSILNNLRSSWLLRGSNGRVFGDEAQAIVITTIEHLKDSIDNSSTWEINNISNEFPYRCANCKNNHRSRYDFCPSCGKSMKG